MISADKALQDALDAACRNLHCDSRAAAHAIGAFLEALPGGGVWFASGAILQPQQLAQHLRNLAAKPLGVHRRFGDTLPGGPSCTACEDTGDEPYATGQHDERWRPCGHCTLGSLWPQAPC